MSHASSRAAVSGFPPFTRPAVTLVGRYPAASVVALIGCIDLAGNFWAGLGFEGFARPATWIACLLTVAVLCSVLRKLPGLAELAAYLALWIGFSLVGGICTYLAGTASRPLADGALAAFDTSFGFDWTAWVHAIRSWPVLNALLHTAYGSLFPQVIGSIVLFSVGRIEGRNQELLCGAAISLLLVTFGSVLFPALGPWVQAADSTLRTAPGYVPDLLTLRGGASLPFVLSRMEGIVSFPSYHTVLAILFIYAHRGIRWSFPVIAVLNGVMLVSVPAEGPHYLADILAGALVAALAIWLARTLCRARSRPTGSAVYP
jgi:PAP2 superfamily